jgi:hypothetical protein
VPVGTEVAAWVKVVIPKQNAIRKTENRVRDLISVASSDLVVSGPTQRARCFAEHRI